MVQLVNISFGYKRRNRIFKDLNLELQPGRIYGLLGKNGAGKSTLLKLISGLIFPNEGKVLIANELIKLRTPSSLERLFIVPEEFELPSVYAKTYLKANAIFYPKFNFPAFEKYIQEFEIPQDTKLNSMSLGQKKKFLLAFGLATEASILILDEPTNGLDIPSKSQFRRIVKGAIGSETTIFISTHQVRDLENLIDTIVILEKGEIIFHESIDTMAKRFMFLEDIKNAGPNDTLIAKEAGSASGIILNTIGISQKVDLEILFNTIIENPNKIKSFLTKHDK